MNTFSESIAAESNVYADVVAPSMVGDPVRLCPEVRFTFFDDGAAPQGFSAQDLCRLVT